MDSTWQSVVLTSGQSIVFKISVSLSTATWHFRITSKMWLASAFISYASYVSSDGPRRQMLHTRRFGPWSTPESTTVTDSWPPVRHLSTCTRSYSPTFMPPPDLFCTSHIIRLFPELCERTAAMARDVWFISVYRCLHGLAPSYLSDLCTPETVHAYLRSSVTLERSLSIPRTKTRTLGLHGFYFASSAAWNTLSVHLRDSELSLNSFKTKLKTTFFLTLGYFYHLICLSCAPTRYFISWHMQMSVLNWWVLLTFQLVIRVDFFNWILLSILMTRHIISIEPDSYNIASSLSKLYLYIVLFRGHVMINTWLEEVYFPISPETSKSKFAV